MLAVGRSPWTLQKTTHKYFDMALASLGLIGTFIVSILTIVRCRSCWQSITMAVWKLVLSVSLGCASIHAASLIGTGYTEVAGQSQDFLTPSAKRRKGPQRILWWTILYIPGVIVGLTGLLSLVIQEIGRNHSVERITLVFGTVIVIFAVLAVVIMVGFMISDGEERGTFGALALVGYTGIGVLLAAMGAIAFLGALYSD